MKFDPIDIVEYIIFIVDEFAVHFGLDEFQSYRYIKNHGGLEFIENNYGVMHTLDDNESVESVAIFCKKNGGLL